MSPEEIEQGVIGFAAAAYRVDAAGLSRDTNIKEELGRSSLSLVGMVASASEEYDVIIGNRDAMAFVTLGDLVDYIVEEQEE